MIRSAICIALIWAVTSFGIGTDIACANTEDKQGDKARITVGTIESKADNCSSSMAAAFGEMLSVALANTDRFILFVDEGAAAGGAEILVTGAVTKFETDAGGGGGWGGIKKKALGTAGVETKEAEIRLAIKLVDVRTKKVIKAKDIKAKSTSWGADIDGSNWVEDVALSGGLDEYSDQPMEDAIRTALAEAVKVVSKEVPDEYYRYTGDERPEATQGAGSVAAPAAAASEAAAGGVAEDMTLYTKYDFVPGNKVIFYDDMKNEEEGEFPYRWNLDNGVYEVVRLGKDYWIMCTDAGSIRPKVQDAPLPEKYTVEFDFYDNGPKFSGHYYHLSWVGADGRDIAKLSLTGSSNTNLVVQGKTKATKTLPSKLTKGVHTMRVMATTRSIKCYINTVRVANVPKVEGFNPVGFRLLMDPWNQEGNPMLVRGFRYAEGGKTMREQLDEDGKIVTHGILFDPDSHTIKGESMKTLKEIGRLLEDDPDLRLSIEGHTDSDGSDDHNMTLSQNRANSVRQYLISTYGVSADRLVAKGWGESKPIDTNDSPEGKANNRRVELVKL
ncbi:MAG: OmpA family protein [Candidatus Krumholzibacteria bacterium]|nr:OmpA family protein [Candidatus Krumholzibacteria bacterium]